MNTCIPAKSKTISMSTRDPYWMTPLVKSMLKTKAKIPFHCCEKLKDINEKIAQGINNRRNCKDPMSTRKWWKDVDNKSRDLVHQLELHKTRHRSQYLTSFLASYVKMGIMLNQYL